MNGFDEAWLQEYRAKMASHRQPREASFEMPSLVTFCLSKPTLLLNQILRMHWTARRNYARGLSAEIARLLPDNPHRRPFEVASVLIRRLSIKEVDYDNAAGGTKFLTDCLLVRSQTHPWGLGIIRDDAPSHLILTVETERVRTRAEQRTVVAIERIR